MSETEMEVLCEYEKRRQANIKENFHLLKSLGLEIKPKIGTAFKVGKGRKKRKRRYSSSSSDSEDEWIPGMEEVTARASRRDQRVPVFRERDQVPLDIKHRVEHRVQEIFQRDQLTSKCPAGRNRLICREHDGIDQSLLPEWLQSDDAEEEDFYGFMIDSETDVGNSDDTTTILSKEWFDLFGLEEPEKK